MSYNADPVTQTRSEALYATLGKPEGVDPSDPEAVALAATRLIQTLRNDLSYARESVAAAQFHLSHANGEPF